MIRGLEDAANKLGIEYKKPKPNSRKNSNYTITTKRTSSSIEDDVPRMYRAQVPGRCSLQYGKFNDLNKWTKEWVRPALDKGNEPKAQYSEPKLGLVGDRYRIKIKFPWRVFTNCGEDSIFRPVIGKDGIPFIPGSSVKGLFRRLALTHSNREVQSQIQSYCGDADHQGLLRFHGAYPVGDWAGTKQVEFLQKGEPVSETRYRMIDVVHPQQDRQVGGTGHPQAIAIVSFFEPELIFELSAQERAQLSQDDWKKVEGWLKSALRPGLGGKTSSGYGQYVIPKDRYTLSLEMKGIGVSSLLRSNEPEFRSNLFKATLRGHASRLLGGVSSQKLQIETAVGKLFGTSEKPGKLELYWEHSQSSPEFRTQGQEKTPICLASGTLRLDAPQRDLEFCEALLYFAYVMGGWGKSWRRIWHSGPEDCWNSGFMQSYSTRAIGCHWEWIYGQKYSNQKTKELEPLSVTSVSSLQDFLNQVRSTSAKYLRQPSPEHMDWKEAFSPQRVTVYAVVTQSSKAISLFHAREFKETPAIGGRNPGDNRPKAISSVWHRMLPVKRDQYLEIVTLFHGDQRPWNDQLPKFRKALEQRGLELVWGGQSREKRR